MKRALAKTITHPGYAFRMIQKKELEHMVHVNCEADDPAGILKYTQFINRTFWIQEEQHNGKYTWEEVPLLKRAQLETVQKLEIFENVEKSNRLMEEGPNYDARSRAKKSRKRVGDSKSDKQLSEQEGGVPL
jgi:hypothetical protein